MTLSDHQGERADSPSYDAFEDLFVNNVDLDLLRNHLGRFNPIKTMGMERMEIRHSAILGWLLNPQETHGLGDAFLKAFLAQALKGQRCDEGPSALDVSQADMMDAEIRREWRNIDLLVLSPNNGWVFIIENKFDSGQHSNQLKRYWEIVTSSVMTEDSYNKLRGIFLTLWDEKPEDTRYASIDYAAICDLLQHVALSGTIPLAPEVEVFIRHYHEVILEATGMSDVQKDMEKLARKLYRDHRRVLDFIIEHGKSTDFTVACDSVFGENLEYPDVVTIGKQSFVYNGRDSNAISFLPKSWFDALGGDKFYWHGCEDWWAGFPVIMWLWLNPSAADNDKQLRLYAEVGPLSDHDFRRDLITAIKNKAQEKGAIRIGFQHGAADEGKLYSKFLKKNFFMVTDMHDHEKIADAIKNALKSFLPEIELVASVLPDFEAHGKTEASNE